MAVAGAAKRYAQAAFEIARQQGTLDQWEENLRRLTAVLQDPTVAEFFASPAVPDEAKVRALEQVLPTEEQRYARNLAMLLLERGRLHQLPEVAEYFHELVLQERGIAIADVTTAVELPPDELRQVQEYLSRLVGMQVQVRSHVDPSIIGGIVARVGDELIDGSVRTQLNRLRERLEQGQPVR
ncbi:MAG: F0F1 ATP synthase subunit delta [Thermomicrobiaceae bacterium]|nr:F0F1 ATP synthase subunit delta [Thermomicrobiaceae bacterium]